VRESLHITCRPEFKGWGVKSTLNLSDVCELAQTWQDEA
jgi:hypothetical protein